MWTFTLVLLLLTSYVHCLDSNVIRSSKEVMDQQQTQVNSQRETVDVDVHNSARRSSRRRSSVSQSGSDSTCADQDCIASTANECRGPKKRERNGSKSRAAPSDDSDKQKVPEMAPCVRSGDCEEGLCCARYLTGKRCQRIPAQGEACLLRRRSKSPRKLDRCECSSGLSCQAQANSPRAQGVCLPRPRHSRRTVRHSRNTGTTKTTCSSG